MTAHIERVRKRSARDGNWPNDQIETVITADDYNCCTTRQRKLDMDRFADWRIDAVMSHDRALRGAQIVVAREPQLESFRNRSYASEYVSTDVRVYNHVRYNLCDQESVYDQNDQVHDCRQTSFA